MKKTVLFAVVAMLCNLAYGQSGALKIKNTTQTCTAYVNIYAVDATTGNFSVCDIVSCTIIVPPLSTTSFADPLAVFTSGNICGATSPLSVAGILAAEAAGTWIWTDATIQFSCKPPVPACAEGGCLLRSAQCLGAPGFCLPTGVNPWSASVCTPLLSGASWSPATTCYMSDVEIDVY